MISHKPLNNTFRQKLEGQTIVNHKLSTGQNLREEWDSLKVINQRKSMTKMKDKHTMKRRFYKFESNK